MISNEAVMQEIGEDIKTRRIDFLDTMFEQRKAEGKSTFRGGQFAGVVKLEDLAIALAEFCENTLPKITPRLVDWQTADQDRAACTEAARAILEVINKCHVHGFGKNKRKKLRNS